ncbi:MAG: NAD(P)H-hydrate epimerase [Sphaerochaetaceae bacterium]
MLTPGFHPLPRHGPGRCIGIDFAPAHPDHLGTAASGQHDHCQGLGRHSVAIFGIGISREITGLYRKTIEIVNESGKPVIAVDIPSGLNGDTGQPMGTAVKARWTVTFHRMKKGLANAEEYTGEVIVEDIGIPEI